MNAIIRVGVDLAKRVIQVHAVDGSGRVVTNRALPRARFLVWCAQLPAGCVIAMEASAGEHHWSRKLRALGLKPRIIAAQLVAPYRMQGADSKNDEQARQAALLQRCADRDRAPAPFRPGSRNWAHAPTRSPLMPRSTAPGACG